MKAVTTFAHMSVRLTGLVLIMLEFLFWTGNALSLTIIAMPVSVILSLALWALALLGARAGGHPISLIICILLGIFVPVVGMTGDRFLYALGTIGIMAEAEELAARIKHFQSSTRSH